MKRRFGRRPMARGGAKSSMQWSDVSTNWTFAGVTGGTQSILIQLQSPAGLANLTSDPPEDLTVLRVVGDWQTLLTTDTSVWTLALHVADVAWTQSASVTQDNDKRVLWSQQYYGTPLAAVGTPTAVIWSPPGTMTVTGATEEKATVCVREAVHIDIAPRVRIEPGKALYLIAYEEQGTGALTVLSYNMRVLYKRSGRR